MAFEDIFKHLGHFGPYQRRIYLLLCLPAVPVAVHKLVTVFIQALPPHRCLLPFEEANASYALPPRQLNLSLPWDARAGSWAACRRLDADFSDEYWERGEPANASLACDRGWAYDRSVYLSSAVTEWDLVCDSAWLRATADAVFMLGDLLGSLVFGDLSDRFGRKPVFFSSLVLQVAAGLLTALAPSVLTYMLARLVVGATTAGVFLVAYVIAMEMVGPRRRLVAGLVVHAFFTVGYVLTTAFAYFIRDWRLLQAVVSLPGIVFFSYWWFVPESARWLLTRGRAAEARELLQRAAKENGVTLPEAALDAVVGGPASALGPDPLKSASDAATVSSGSLLDLVRTPNLRRKSLIVFFVWFVNSCTYYGLSWNTSSLGGNDFVNFCAAGAVEFPAYALLWFTLDRWGRKAVQCVSMLLGGAALLLTLAVPAGAVWATITLVMLGKLAITASFATIYVFSAELFPTVIRNVGIGASSTCARVGGISAPYINLLSDTWRPLPALVFGGLTAAAGLLSLLLPETAGHKLPDSVAEGEAFDGAKGEEAAAEEGEPTPAPAPAQRPRDTARAI